MTINEVLQNMGIGQEWAGPLQSTFEHYNIDTPRRQACFIGQCAHESGNFKTLEENLHYSAASLMRVWPSRFPDMDTAEKYANNPEKIANKVYAGRMGNTEDGEGFRYRGRGLIQLTGKEAYANCGSNVGVDFVGNPDLVSTPEYAALSAGWFWNKRGLNQLADTYDIPAITQRVNGGLLGLDDRKAKSDLALKLLGA
jgi:putative chitinase